MIDALVKVDNQYIHIELNSQNQAYLRNRNFSFFTGIYSKKTKTGEDYINLEDFIHIDLTYGLSKNLKEKVEKINKETWFTPWISDEEDDRRILNMEKKLSFMEGQKQTQLETAKNFKSLGVDIETISKATSLSIEEIEKL